MKGEILYKEIAKSIAEQIKKVHGKQVKNYHLHAF